MVKQTRSKNMYGNWGFILLFGIKNSKKIFDFIISIVNPFLFIKFIIYHYISPSVSFYRIDLYVVESVKVY